MMRRSLTTLTLVLICGLLLLGAALAVAIAAGARSGARAKGVDASSADRTWPLSMSAAPEDLALALLSFQHPAHGERISDSSLQVAVKAPFGDDYLAAAALQRSTPGAPRMLVLLVNRPSPLLDPVSVHVQLIARRALGAPSVRILANPLSRAAGSSTPALCRLGLHGSALSASELRPLHSRGQALTGFDAGAAVAQAYDVICGLPYTTSFVRAIAPATAPSPPAPEVPAPVVPEAPAPVPTGPSPAPPGRIPGEGCEPRPGYACPAAVTSGSARLAGDGARRAAAGAH
jgi:hypothetical protein